MVPTTALEMGHDGDRLQQLLHLLENIKANIIEGNTDAALEQLDIWMADSVRPKALGSETVLPIDDHGELISPGLTKREFYASTAMQGLLAAGYSPEDTELGRLCVRMADGLLFALANRSK